LLCGLALSALPVVGQTQPDLAAKAGLPADPDFDPAHVMDKPGFKVMHIQDVDYRSVVARCNPVLQPKGCQDALLDLP
jgi:hypothetical protein